MEDAGSGAGLGAEDTGIATTNHRKVTYNEIAGICWSKSRSVRGPPGQHRWKRRRGPRTDKAETHQSEPTAQGSKGCKPDAPRSEVRKILPRGGVRSVTRSARSAESLPGGGKRQAEHRYRDRYRILELQKEVFNRG